MTRYLVGQDIVYSLTVKNNGVLATPTTIAFQYKIERDGTWVSVTPVAVSTGYYTATVNLSDDLDAEHPLYWKWTTTGPNYTEKGHDYIWGDYR